MILGQVALVWMASSDLCQTSAVTKIYKDDDPAEPLVLATTAGAYQLAGQDFIDPRHWRRGDHLQICSQPGPGGWVKIVNSTRAEILSAQKCAPRCH